MNFHAIAHVAAFAGLVIASTNSLAVTVPFTATFESGAANWRTADLDTLVTVVTTGGADGGQYASAARDLSTAGSQTVLFRCHDSRDCSGDTFVGDWTADVETLSFAIRHDATTPLEFFARIATADNFPGYGAETTVLVAPNTWTTLTFAIDFANSLLNAEGPPTPAFFASVFGNVGNLQIGVAAPTDYTGPDVNFDLDQVAIAPVPLPAAAWLMLSAVGGLLGFARRT